MDLMSLLVRIGADTSGAEQGIKKTQTLGQKLSKSLKTAAKVGATAITAATTAVVAFTKSSVDVGKQFDASMSQVAATMGKTTDEIEDLRKFAQKMGRETAFSATQAAEALNYMALAGYDSETSMKMLPNVLNLAAAGGMELATASDMVTDAQSALGLTLDETSDMVDKMAKASSKSNTSVAQLGEAFLTVGGTAKDLAGGTTELSTVLGILADNGVKGAEGGTALRNIILALEAPTKKSAAAMEELGLQVFDANGNMRPMEEIFGDLNDRLATMNQGERTQVLNEIFNKVDLKSVNALLATNVDRWDELSQAIDGAWYTTDSLTSSLDSVGLSMDTMQANLSKLGITTDNFNYSLDTSNGNASDFVDTLLETADAGVTYDDVVKAMGGDLGSLQKAFDSTTGAAQQMADTQLDNLEGDITLFKSALEGAQIALSDVLSPALREFVQFGTGAVSELTEAFEKDGLNGAMDALGHIISDGIGLIIDGLPGFIDAGIQLLGAIVKGIIDNLPKLADAALQIGSTVITNISNYIHEHNPQLASVLDTISQKVSEVFEAIKGFWEKTLKPALSSMWTWISTVMLPAVRAAWENIQPKIEAVFVAITGFWNDTLKPVLSEMWKWISETLLPAIGEAWQAFQPKVEAVFVAIKGFWEETLQPVLSTMWTWISETMLPAVSEAWAAIQPKIEAVFVAIQGFWETILKPAFEAIKAFLEETLGPVFENTFNGIKAVVDNGLQAIKDLWENSVKPIYEGIIEFFSGVFSGNWEEAWNGIQTIVQGVWDAIQIAAETIWENAKTWGATIIENFKIAFTNAWDLVSADVLGIWDNITNKAEEIWTAALEWGKNIINNFKTSLETAWENVKQWFIDLWDKIKAIPQEFIDSALNWGKDLIDNFKQGIDNAWQGLKDKVSDVGQSIKNFLGFSKPKEGPLSDFDTYAPDMMDLFVKGINDNMHTITTALSNMVSNVKAAFKLAGEGGYKEFDQGLNGYWGNQLIDVIKNPMKDAYDQAWNMEWWKLGEHIYNSVAFYCDWIRDKFKNTFDFSNMYVKTPHWWVDSWYEISGTYYPNMSVHWYRKAYDNPVMFTSPTVLGTANGLKGFGDGPGGEIVLSEDRLRSIVGGAGDTYNTINVYQREGENMDNFVRRIEEIMARHENQRKAAFA